MVNNSYSIVDSLMYSYLSVDSYWFLLMSIDQFELLLSGMDLTYLGWPHMSVMHPENMKCISS